MSNFYEQQDDSNLQYDDAAFLYFIASTLSISALVLTCSVFKNLWRLKLKNTESLQKSGIFVEKLRNMRSLRRSNILNCSLLLKILFIIVCCVVFLWVSNTSQETSSKLKGFDPYEILEVNKDASISQIKKSYRVLARKYHPDKNPGDPQAHKKFIMISKSYECFTNEEKKANCFKFGNPDGQQSYRIGIGLPNFFIKKQYQFYVLPIVLFILLVLVPAKMISWNNKTKVLDKNGVSIGCYPILFKLVEQKINKFTIPYILASYSQLWEDQKLGPISAEDQQKLETFLKERPYMTKKVHQQLNPNQLNILWQILSYTCKIKQFSKPSFRIPLERYLNKTLNVVMMWGYKKMDKTILFNNPQWTIRHQGIHAFNSFVEFQRDYFNRTLGYPNSNQNWLYSLDLQDSEVNHMMKIIRTTKMASNLFQTIASSSKIKQFCTFLPEKKRGIVEKQVRSWPVFNISLKLKVMNKEVKKITNMDYAQIYFKLEQLNETTNYSYLHHYPYPRKDKVYILGVQNGDIQIVKEITMKEKEKQIVDVISYRSNKDGDHTMVFFVVHSSCWGIDLVTKLCFNVKAYSEAAMKRKKVIFHKEDMYMERLYKNFIEEFIDITKDDRDHQLSDSDQEEYFKEGGLREEGESSQQNSEEDSDESEQSGNEASESD